MPDQSTQIDPDEQQRVGAVRDFFIQLRKCIKTIGLYRHNVAQYATYLEPAYKALMQALEKCENIGLAVEQMSLCFHGVPVYEDQASDQNLAFKFYRDGVRMLVFRKNLGSQELLDFVLVCLTRVQADEAMQEDMVSLLWKKDFKNIEYVVIESFALGSQGTEQTKLEVDKIVSYLYGRLTSQSTDSHQFARLSLDDLELEIEDVKQVAGVNIAKQAAGQAEKDAIQAEMLSYDRTQLLPRFSVILTDIFSGEIDEQLGQKLVAAFDQLFDGYLLNEDLPSIDNLLAEIEKITKSALPPESLAWANQVALGLRHRMSQESTIARLGDMLDARSDRDSYQRIYRYLIGLDSSATVAMLRTLESLNKVESRHVFCEALSVLGRDVPEVFAQLLSSPKANLVRDMLYILDKLNPPDKTRMVAGLLTHPNLALRMEALKSIADSDDPGVGAYLTRALRDKDPQVRTTAAGLLPGVDPIIARQSLMAIAERTDFEEKPEREQVAVWAALSSIGTPDILEYLQKQLRTSSLLGKKKLAGHKKSMVAGMANSGSIAVYRLLKAELEAGIRDQDVAAAVERACKRLKERLLGG
ncbi:MAG TPA: HEAT repeat domain-containing protein [Myxococcota bacterium]|nr:HEAT repeat domain-containing protein [Myxococcota bacterium]